MSAAAKPAPHAEVVTKAEILELAKAEREHADAQAAASKAESTVKALRLSLVERVLGLTSDELKYLSQDEVQRLYLLRLHKHLWKPEKSAPLFVFEETSHARRPDWKDLYVELEGEAAALAVIADTLMTYSYRVKVEV